MTASLILMVKLTVGLLAAPLAAQAQGGVSSLNS